MFHIIVVFIIRIYRSIVASVKPLFVIGRYIVALVSELNLSVCVWGEISLLLLDHCDLQIKIQGPVA
nr:hypothetical protein CFP56_25673 [Quercus suber]